MATALLFPGQGSQVPGMRELVEHHAPELCELAVAGAGTDPFERAGESTALAQPAIVATSLALWTAAGRPRAAYLAGHSMGELGALAAAGSLRPEDAVRLACARGVAMARAAAAAPGAMVALLGEREAAIELASECGLAVANDNGPTQLVAAGAKDAVEAAMSSVRARGLRAIELAVSGAFHTEAMLPAVAPYREALESVGLQAPSTPVFSSSTAAPFATEAAGIRDQLAAAVTRPVRWRETLDALHRLGVREYLEVGPGKALTGMVRRSLADVEARVLASESAGRERAHA